jgi:hypothetical protein
VFQQGRHYWNLLLYRVLKHSAKALLSVTLGKERSVKILLAKSSLLSAIYRALGKDRNQKIMKK